ncbi:hypothetical protein B0T24DRAFT_672576 [Lasiosphaeria ovina]|uniref:EthD domain-containing protein n=1 Tax=Lasiosphaeria ovina TaxID=92902 RepID=A0AAE0NJC3_9PEZI|nr:hypothetical protein B0T24DRAFT_672576 [Lasiosphaeria ovina]
MSASATSPGRLLRLTLQIYTKKEKPLEEGEKFSREYLSKVAGIHARNGIEIYQMVYTPAPFREALDGMNRRNKRGWVIDDHDITVEFYFRSFAELTRVNQDPEFQALQAAEGPYVNLVHTVAALGWVEKYVDGGRIVHLGADGKSTYPPWAELRDISTALPPAQAQAEDVESAPA